MTPEATPNCKPKQPEQPNSNELDLSAHSFQKSHQEGAPSPSAAPAPIPRGPVLYPKGPTICDENLGKLRCRAITTEEDRNETEIGLCFNLGSNTDGDSKGKAHFFEHLMAAAATVDGFTGFHQISRQMKSWRIELTTSEDTLAISVTCPNAEIETALHFLKSMLTFSDETTSKLSDGPNSPFETEKLRIRRECATRQGERCASVYQLVKAAIFNGTPYEHPVIGTKDSVENMTADTVLSTKALLTDENTTLLVMGPPNTVERVKQSFAEAIDHFSGKQSPPQPALQPTAQDIRNTVTENWAKLKRITPIELSTIIDGELAAVLFLPKETFSAEEYIVAEKLMWLRLEKINNQGLTYSVTDMHLRIGGLPLIGKLLNIDPLGLEKAIEQTTKILQADITDDELETAKVFAKSVIGPALLNGPFHQRLFPLLSVSLPNDENKSAVDSIVENINSASKDKLQSAFNKEALRFFVLSSTADIVNMSPQIEAINEGRSS